MDNTGSCFQSPTAQNWALRGRSPSVPKSRWLGQLVLYSTCTRRRLSHQPFRRKGVNACATTGNPFFGGEVIGIKFCGSKWVKSQRKLLVHGGAQ